MFTIEQVKEAHSKVKSGADFPKYISEINALGVNAYEYWVKDGHTNYFGNENFEISSKPMYEALAINEVTDKNHFEVCLKNHQSGKTDFKTFCKDCADSGIVKWVVSINEKSCTYFDQKGESLLAEAIPL